MAVQIFVVNTTVDADGYRIPNLATPISYVGNLYEKTGNVFKYVLKTDTDLTGLPGVFGPITEEQVQTVVDADGGTFRGWKASDASSWRVHGER